MNRSVLLNPETDHEIGHDPAEQQRLHARLQQARLEVARLERELSCVEDTARPMPANPDTPLPIAAG